MMNEEEGWPFLPRAQFARRPASREGRACTGEEKLLASRMPCATPVTGRVCRAGEERECGCLSRCDLERRTFAGVTRN